MSTKLLIHNYEVKDYLNINGNSLKAKFINYTQHILFSLAQERHDGVSITTKRQQIFVHYNKKLSVGRAVLFMQTKCRQSHVVTTGLHDGTIIDGEVCGLLCIRLLTFV
jgi:hypothetical protein